MNHEGAKMLGRTLAGALGAILSIGGSDLGAQDGLAERMASADQPEVFVIEMVDISPTEFEYRPAHVTVTPGSVLRFVQTGVMPHNVDWRAGPPGADFGASRLGPFLIQPGTVYEVAIDDRFPAGDYAFVCTPHEFMGMKGTMTVVSDESDAVASQR